MAPITGLAIEIWTVDGVSELAIHWWMVQSFESEAESHILAVIWYLLGARRKNNRPELWGVLCATAG